MMSLLIAKDVTLPRTTWRGARHYDGRANSARSATTADFGRDGAGLFDVDFIGTFKDF